MIPLNPYPKIRAAGDIRLHKGLISCGNPVVIQEKVDGSQFSAVVQPNGQLQCRSKGVIQTLDTCADMFRPAIQHLTNIVSEIPTGVVLRCETLAKPQHNVLKYERTPRGHLVLFDVHAPGDHYWGETQLRELAEELGIEYIPPFHEGILQSWGAAEQYFGRVSALGGCPIEGVVVKARSLRGTDGDLVVAKMVTEDFKEQHKKDYVKKPSRTDKLLGIGEQFATAARYRKAVQWLQEQNLATNSVADIGPLMKRLSEDFEDENVEAVKDELWKVFGRDIRTAANGGFPDWYKQQLNQQLQEAA